MGEIADWMAATFSACKATCDSVEASNAKLVELESRASALEAKLDTMIGLLGDIKENTEGPITVSLG